MSDAMRMTAHAAAQTARVGWYWGLSRAMLRQSKRAGLTSDYKPTRPIPSLQDMLGELARLLADDAKAVRDGVYPPMPEAGDTPGRYVRRVRDMIADAPVALGRRAAEDTDSVRSSVEWTQADLPPYYAQDFHFQTGGYLTEHSARLYDVQVETLFMGAAGPMRRRVLRAVADTIRGRDQRALSLLDVACGTGRFLRQARLAFPRLKLAGLDLSQAYLGEAERSFEGLYPAHWYRANAERMPLDASSQDIVTCVFLFHELPPEVRRVVARDMARVLKPGGHLIFMDSLQFGDRPSWDGLLEAFPVRFHEPYYRHYIKDDLPKLFAEAGFDTITMSTPFMAKLLVCRKT